MEVRPRQADVAGPQRSMIFRINSSGRWKSDVCWECGLFLFKLLVMWTFWRVDGEEYKFSGFAAGEVSFLLVAPDIVEGLCCVS